MGGAACQKAGERNSIHEKRELKAKGLAPEPISYNRRDLNGSNDTSLKKSVDKE